MRDLDRVTARGHGVWGKRYDIELATNQTTRQDSTGLHSQTITSYHLLVSDPAVGRRRFDSEAERAAFLEGSFTDLALDTLEPPEDIDRHHPLAGLIGEELAFVTFVRDYVQLGLDSPPINLYAWPCIHTRGLALKRPDAGYADALIGLINTRLADVDELLDHGLVLDFGDGTRLAVPLDGTGLVGAEVAEYTDRRSQRTIVWRPGDEPIAWRTEKPRATSL
jgi:hypothetical protein